MPHRQHRNANGAPQGKPRLKGGRDKRADWVAGTLVELDADQGRLTVRVAEARRPQLRAGDELRIAVAGAIVKAADGDGDGHPGIRDLFPGDELHIVLAPAADGTPLTAARITQSSPGGPAGGLRRVWET